MVDVGALLAPFYAFTWTLLVQTLTDPTSLAVIAGLVISEGLLSADNAVVLAMLVRHLPEEQRRKALYYGIVGAWSFRIIAIAISVYLTQTEWIQIIGGLYLFHLVIGHFAQDITVGNRSASAEDISKLSDIGLTILAATTMPGVAGQIPVIVVALYLIYKFIATHGVVKDSEEFDAEKVSKMGFWRTVFEVECMDIAFSTDSIMAAIGISQNVWIRLIGELAGIFCMRYAASLFLRIIDWCPRLEHTAYILIAIVATKMITSGMGVYEMSNVLFIGIMMTLFIGTLAYEKYVIKPREASAAL